MPGGTPNISSLTTGPVVSWNRMRRSLAAGIVVLGFVVIPTSAPLLALDPIVVGEGFKEFPVGTKMEILEDKSREMTIDDVASPENDAAFHPSPEAVPSFGFTTSVYWVRFKIKYSAGSAPSLYLESDYPPLDEVTFYSKRDGRWRSTTTGDTFPFAQRDLAFRNTIFLVRLDASGDETYFLRFKTESSMIIPLHLWSAASFLEKVNIENYGHGFYYGIIVIMVFYNLLLFFSIRDATYLLYVAYVTAFGLNQFALSGLAAEFLWGGSPWMANFASVIFIVVAALSLTLFTVNFLNTKTQLPRWNFALIACLVYFVCLLILTFLVPYRITVKMGAGSGLVFVPLVLTIAVRSLMAGNRAARFYLLAFVAIFAGMFVYMLKMFGFVPHNILTNNGWQIGSALEVLLLSLALGDRFKIMKEDKEKAQKELLERQTILTQSYARFVPEQMFSLLEKSDVTQVSLGDATQTEITILFSDIRSFTTLSESMTPQENFDFLNAIMKRTGPVIRENHGFVDKFIGDAIMALFPRSPEDAIQAAIQMKLNLGLYNVRRKGKGLDPLKAGIGINTGSVILGTVGEPQRMDATVISDTVNLASRIEGLTKHYDAALLVTGQTLFRLPDPTKYNFRMLERVKVKGKSETVSVFEIFDGDTPEEISLKVATQRSFEHGVQHHLNQEFDQAITLFKKVLDINPVDGAAKLYLQRSEHYARHGAPPDWTGVAVMESK